MARSLARLWGRIGAGDDEDPHLGPARGRAAGAAPGLPRAPGRPHRRRASRSSTPRPATSSPLVSERPAVRPRRGLARSARRRPKPPSSCSPTASTPSDLPDHPCLLRSGAAFADPRRHRRGVRAPRRTCGASSTLRALVEPREKLGILLQPDPDPDGIACGYALRALLGRKRPTAPLISFGEVKRPENRAMVQALGIDVRTIDARASSTSSTASRSSTSSPRCSERTRPRACARWTW